MGQQLGTLINERQSKAPSEIKMSLQQKKSVQPVSLAEELKPRDFSVFPEMVNDFRLLTPELEQRNTQYEYSYS